MFSRSHRGVVFIADDEDGLRDMVQELLERAGYLFCPRGAVPRRSRGSR